MTKNLFTRTAISLSLLSLAVCGNTVFAAPSDNASTVAKSNYESRENRIVNVKTSEELTTALADAKAGDTIRLHPGAVFTGKFKLYADGTVEKPIILETANANQPATFDSVNIHTGYTVHITGDNWIIRDVKIQHGQKGVMTDNANNVVLDHVEVFDTGTEAVHFRDGSLNNVIKNSHVHHTGLYDAGIGEGIYVGSDKNKWKSRGGTFSPDVHNAVIANNIIGPGVTSEGIDIKEGTIGTEIYGNTFDGAGMSGVETHFSDSFIDVKGNDVRIYGNTFRANGNEAINDAIQMHQQLPGWGLNADFFDNSVELVGTTGYIVNASKGTTGRAHNNTRTPAGNMYKGNITQY